MNVFFFDSGSICIHGKELLRQFAFHQKYMRKYQLLLEQSDGIFGVSQNQLGRFSMETVISDEEVICLSHAKVYVFSDSVFCLGKMNQNPTSSTVWERQFGWFKDSSQYRTLDTIHGDPMEFEWNIQDSPHCSSSTESKSYEHTGRTRTIPRTNYLHVDVQ